MTKQKVVLVACGTAIATSTVVAHAIEEGLKQRGIQAVIRQCKVSEVPSLASGADLVVTTTPVSGNFGIPVIQTLAFLTGIGKEDALREIVEKLQD